MWGRKIAGADEYAGFEDYLRTHDCVVLQDVDGHDHIGGGRAFNHSALYWHKQPTVPGPQEGKGGGDGGHKSRAIADNTGSETKNLSESVQDIISNMKTHSICVDNSIKRYQKGIKVLVSVTRINPGRKEPARVIMHDFSNKKVGYKQRPNAPRMPPAPTNAPLTTHPW